MRISLAALAAVLLGACGSSRPAPGAAAPGRDAAAEAASYDRYRRPDLLVAALGLRPGDEVADVGAGHGYLTFRLAAAVGAAGRVVATDVDPAALLALAGLRAAAGGARAVTPRLVGADDPGLEAGRFDLVLLAEVDHLLPDRAAYLRRLVPALAPGGRIAVSNRAPYRPRALAAARAAGLIPVGEAGGLPGQFLVLLAPEAPR